MKPKHNTKFTDGCVDDGEFQGLYIVPLAICMRDSSWDYSSFIGCFNVDGHSDIPEWAMYVKPEHLPILAVVFNIPPDEYEAFARDFPDDWDT